VWTERSDLKITWSGESYTDAHKAHDVLGEYIEQEPHKEMLATVDHVALFSGSVKFSVYDKMARFLCVLTFHLLDLSSRADQDDALWQPI